MFLSSIIATTFTGLDYIWVTRRVSYKKPELLTLREHLRALPVFCGLRLAHLLRFFVVSYYVSLCSEFRVICVCTEGPGWLNELGSWIT